MSEPINPLDKLFREKLENRSFPVDMEHWNEATKLMDQNKKKRRGLFWIFGALGILLIGGMMYGISNLDLSSKEELATNKSAITKRDNKLNTNSTKQVLSENEKISGYDVDSNDRNSDPLNKKRGQTFSKPQSSKSNDTNNQENTRLASQSKKANVSRIEKNQKLISTNIQRENPNISKDDISSIRATEELGSDQSSVKLGTKRTSLNTISKKTKTLLNGQPKHCHQTLSYLPQS